MRNINNWIVLVLIAIIPVIGRTQTCITSECHSSLNTGQYVHMPVESGDCSVCHASNDRDHPEASGSEFALTTQNITELCGNCHSVDTKQQGLHTPVATGMCLTCHNPHGSDQPYLLASSSQGALCNQCHDAGMQLKTYVHGPTAVGACGVCHLSHNSMGNALLRTESVNELCYQCHIDQQDEISGFEFVHGPVASNCAECHNPHDSDVKYFLSGTKSELCYECHLDVQQAYQNNPVKHKALEQDQECMNCHNAHGSDVRFNLIDDSFDLCVSCHDHPMQNGKITDIATLLNTHPNWHGPIENKDCSGCHQVHSSQHFRLLQFNYPADFYASFDLANYELCFQCHSSENVQDSTTTNLTNFRNGDQNLHYLHVNREKGRTCRSCHETHASNQSFHIRESVPYGAWQLPINFSKSDAGGSCAPGCHKLYSYQR